MGGIEGEAAFCSWSTGRPAERQASGAADSGSEARADAGSRRLHAVVRLVMPPPHDADTMVVLPFARSLPPCNSSAQAYLITSSASRSREGGIVIPSALAVLRLMTSSNFTGCSTGRSAGFVPLRILST
jgi:hypothetical protein